MNMPRMIMYVFGWLAQQSFVPSSKCEYEWISNYYYHSASVPSNFKRGLRMFTYK